MKNFNQYLIIVFTACIIFAGCKEQNMMEMEHYIKQVFLVGSGEEGDLLVRNVSLSEKESYISTAVCISGSLAPEQDVHIVLEEDKTGIDNYNQKYKAEKDVKYQTLPSENYEITNKEPIIKAGEVQAIVSIRINPQGLHCDSLYAIPLKIKSCNEYPLAEPDGIVLLGVSTYNLYSGSYNYNGEKDGIAFNLLRTATAVDSNTIRIYNSGNEILDNVKNEGVKISINTDNSLTIQGWDKMKVISGEGTYTPENKTYSFNFTYEDTDNILHTVSGTLTPATDTLINE